MNNWNPRATEPNHGYESRRGYLGGPKIQRYCNPSLSEAARGRGANGMKPSAAGGGDWFRPTPHCNRHFYSRTETLAFYDRGTVQPLMPDLILSTTLKEEDNDDLTFEET